MRYITIPAAVVVNGNPLTWAELVKTWTSDQIFGRNVDSLLQAVHVREALAGAPEGAVVPIDEAAWTLLTQAATTPSSPYVPDSGIAIISIIQMIKAAPDKLVPPEIRNTNGRALPKRA